MLGVVNGECWTLFGEKADADTDRKEMVAIANCIVSL